MRSIQGLCMFQNRLPQTAKSIGLQAWPFVLVMGGLSGFLHHVLSQPLPKADCGPVGNSGYPTARSAPEKSPVLSWGKNTGPVERGHDSFQLRHKMQIPRGQNLRPSRTFRTSQKPPPSPLPRKPCLTRSVQSAAAEDRPDQPDPQHPREDVTQNTEEPQRNVAEQHQVLASRHHDAASDNDRRNQN